MKRFIFAKREGIYIIDLAKSLVQLREAQRFIYETVAHGKDVIFVGTKKSGPGDYQGSRHPLRASLHHQPLAGRHAHQSPEYLHQCPAHA